MAYATIAAVPSDVLSPSAQRGIVAFAEAKAAPTPAHIQQELELSSVPLADTPRAATAALLTMAAGRNQSIEL